VRREQVELLSHYETPENPPSVLKQSAHIATKKNSAAVRHRVPRLSEGKDDKETPALPHRGDYAELLHQIQSIRLVPDFDSLPSSCIFSLNSATKLLQFLQEGVWTRTLASASEILNEVVDKK
jgi:hypothetical protein